MWKPWESREDVLKNGGPGPRASDAVKINATKNILSSWNIFLNIGYLIHWTQLFLKKTPESTKNLKLT